MSPLISVVMTTYNEMPHKLPVAIHSIMGQTFQDFELIVYHDGRLNQSFDATEEFMENLFPCCGAASSDSRVRFFAPGKQQGNYGFPMRNAAMQHLKGKWVVHTSGDNYHLPIYLERFAQAINSNPDAVMVHGDILHNYFSYDYFPTSPGVGGIDLMCMAARLDIAKEIPFGLWSGADGEYSQKLADRGKVVRIPKCIGVHH